MTKTVHKVCSGAVSEFPFFVVVYIGRGNLGRYQTGENTPSNLVTTAILADMANQTLDTAL